MDDKPPTYTLVVRPTPDPEDKDGIRRLRHLLKWMLRVCRIRCISIEPEVKDDTES